MRLYEYTLGFEVGDASAQTGQGHAGRMHGEMPADAVIIAIVDPENKQHAAAWIRLDTLGDDRDLKARVIGTSLLDAIGRAKPAES